MVDSMTIALKYLRDVRVAQNDDEVKAKKNERAVPRRRLKSLYPRWAFTSRRARRIPSPLHQIRTVTSIQAQTTTPVATASMVANSKASQPMQ